MWLPACDNDDVGLRANSIISSQCLCLFSDSICLNYSPSRFPEQEISVSQLLITIVNTQNVYFPVSYSQAICRGEIQLRVQRIESSLPFITARYYHNIHKTEHVSSPAVLGF